MQKRTSAIYHFTEAGDMNTMVVGLDLLWSRINSTSTIKLTMSIRCDQVKREGVYLAPFPMIG